MTPSTTDQGNSVATARARYEALSVEREPYLTRARDCARLTIPALLPPDGSTGSTNLPTPFQAVGARGVNHLASKLHLALFPPGTSFFRLRMEDFVRRELEEQAAGDVQDAFSEFEKALANIENAVVTRMETTGARTRLFEAMKHLVCCGNFLIHIGKEGRLRGFRMDSFVVRRGADGEPVEILTEEEIARDTAPEAVKEILNRNPSESEGTGGDHDKVSVFTWIRLDGDRWTVHQEVEDEKIPSSEGNYPKDKPAWLPLRFIAVDGEDYGRSLAEEYLGDLRTTEILSQALVEGSAAAARVIYLVDETGQTNKDDIADAPSGSVVNGQEKDIGTLQLNKTQDLSVAQSMLNTVEQRLSQVFLLFSDLPRHAERVTATEIQQIVTELEDSLGGVYSVLAEELQRPLAARLLHRMAGTKGFPSLPKDTVAPQITTGLEALGRNHDLLKLDHLITGLQQLFGPEAVSEYVNVGAYVSRRAAALGLITKGLVRSEEEVQQARQERQQAEMMNNLGGDGLKFIGDRMKAGEEAQPTPEE